MIELAIVALLTVTTMRFDWRAHVEIERFEGERTLSVCAWRYQRPPIYCVDISINESGRNLPGLRPANNKQDK